MEIDQMDPDKRHEREATTILFVGSKHENILLLIISNNVMRINWKNTCFYVLE